MPCQTLNHSLHPTAGRRDDHFTTRLRSPPRKDKRGVDLISDALPFGRLWLRLNQTLGATQSDTR
jgi:hypothetical protein